MNEPRFVAPFGGGAGGWGGVAVLLVALALGGISGCASSYPPNTTVTNELVSVDTLQEAGITVASVFQDDRFVSQWRQHHVPVDTFDIDRTGEVQTKTLVRTPEPLRKLVPNLSGYQSMRVHAFALCRGHPGPDCTPDRVTLFFYTISTIPSGWGRYEPAARRQLVVGERDEPEFERTLAYANVRRGDQLLEKMWTSIPYDTFESMTAGEELRVVVGRDSFTFSGSSLRVLRALGAALRGENEVD